MTAFSRQKCHETRAAVKPSLPFLDWLASSSSPGWQLRGDLDLGDEEPPVSDSPLRSLRKQASRVTGVTGAFSGKSPE